MPLAHAHLERLRMSSDSSQEESPAGLPTPKASAGCSLQLNKESCVSSLASCPESTSFGGYGREFQFLKEGGVGSRF